METMEILLAAFRDASYVVINHPAYSALGSVVLFYGLLKFYCSSNKSINKTLGICDSDRDMSGKTVLITGATAGVGKWTALDLARRNARIIMACRNMGKARRVADEIKSSTGNTNVAVVHLDLSSFASVRKCAVQVLKTEKRLDVLINNAGILIPDKRTTEDGNEMVLQSNYLGHFLLTLLLLDLIKKSAPSRIVNVSSSSYSYGKLDLSDLAGKKCKSDFEFYSRSKQAFHLFTRELSSRLADSGVTVNTLCPGLVKTEIVSHSIKRFALKIRLNMWLHGKSCEEGAQTTIYLAVHPEVETTTGKYFTDCKEQQIHENSLDRTLAKKLFEVSEEIVGISYPKK